MEQPELIILDEYKIEKIVNILSFSSMCIYTFDKNYKGKLERHKQHEFIYVIDGTEIINSNNNEYTLEKGQAFLHKPYISHADKPKSQNSKVFIFSFTCVGKNIEKLYDKVLTLTKEEHYYISQIIDTASNYFKPNECYIFYSGKNEKIPKNIPYGIGQIIKNRIELLFIDMLSKMFENGNEEKTNNYNDQLTERIIEELKKHIHEKFSLSLIADKLNYSRNYLCRHFKKNTNLSINQYFYQLKIEEAKKMLAKGDESIEFISDSLSFSNVQYFSLTFKKAVGITPSLWRKNAKNNLFF